MVLWSKDKLPDVDMSSGAIEAKMEGGPPSLPLLNSNGSVSPVILAAGPEEVGPDTGGELELTEVTSLAERAGEAGGDEERSEIVVAMDCRANAKGQREEDALLENASQCNESDDTSTDQSPEPPPPLKETSFSIGLQVVFPFLLAGFGTVAAGMVLDIVQVSDRQHFLCYIVRMRNWEIQVNWVSLFFLSFWIAAKGLKTIYTNGNRNVISSGTWGDGGKKNNI